MGGYCSQGFLCLMWGLQSLFLQLVEASRETRLAVFIPVYTR